MPTTDAVITLYDGTRINISQDDFGPYQDEVTEIQVMENKSLRVPADILKKLEYVHGNVIVVYDTYTISVNYHHGMYL